MVDFRNALPWREFDVIANNHRDVYFSFVDLNDPIPRPRYEFPEGTDFQFRSDEGFVDIDKAGEYDTDTRFIKVSFLPADTQNIVKDQRAYYEMDAIFPPEDPEEPEDRKRYTILRGHMLISSHQNLNG